MVELLDVARQELRATVPADTAAERTAAWSSLEQRLSGPATVVTFPVRWAPAYAAAAVLGFAVLSGVVGNDWFGAEALPEQAAVAEVEISEPARILQPDVPDVVVPPSALPAFAQVPVVSAPIESAPIESVPERTEEPSLARSAMPAGSAMKIARQAPPRYQLVGLASGTVPARKALRVAQAPAIADLRIKPVVLGWGGGLVVDVPASRVEQRSKPEPLTLAAAQAVVEGHWTLRRAKVWREDIAPVWTADGLVFRGTVENEEVRETVSRAIRSAQKGAGASIELHARNGAANTTTFSAANSGNLGVTGGLVRTSLLEHFNDSARRSFASTESSALESELDRFVNNVFESQSSLPAHAYKLNGLVQAIPVALAPELARSSRFGELVSIHASEVRREQSRIYDLLSETLARKYWSYKAKDDNVSSASLHAEAEALLRNALDLDANLTALLSTPRHVVDAGDADISCGEALSRIRTRVNRIKTDTAKLR